MRVGSCDHEGDVDCIVAFTGEVCPLCTEQKGHRVTAEILVDSDRRLRGLAADLEAALRAYAPPKEDGRE